MGKSMTIVMLGGAFLIYNKHLVHSEKFSPIIRPRFIENSENKIGQIVITPWFAVAVFGNQIRDLADSMSNWKL